VKLIITEKPSVAQTLAAILGATQRRDGYFEGNGWLISWCYGHLVEMAPADAYGEQYKRWSYDSLPILPDVWKYRAADGKKKQLDILRSLMNLADVDAVVCGTDAGREGELIFRWVYDQCKCKKPVQRLWIFPVGLDISQSRALASLPSIKENRQAGHSVFVTTSARALRESNDVAWISIKSLVCLAENASIRLVISSNTSRNSGKYVKNSPCSFFWMISTILPWVVIP